MSTYTNVQQTMQVNVWYFAWNGSNGQDSMWQQVQQTQRLAGSRLAVARLAGDHSRVCLPILMSRPPELSPVPQLLTYYIPKKLNMFLP